MIRSETNEKMDLEGHYPQNTISHCFISNETQITLHFFQGRISARPEIRTDLFLAIPKAGMCFFNFINNKDQNIKVQHFINVRRKV